MRKATKRMRVLTPAIAVPATLLLAGLAAGYGTSAGAEGAGHASGAGRGAVRARDASGLRQSHQAASQSRSATAHAEGLAVTLTATPDRVRRGAAVRLLLSARAKHATGALYYELAYGDGTKAPPVVIPEYCRAGNPPPATASWHFSHRYRSAGHYRVSAVVAVNCGGGHVRVSLPVTVR